MKNTLYATLLGLATLSTLPLSNAAEITLSEAFDYNAFILGDYTGYKSDVEGNLAVGGNLTVSDFDIGLQLAPDLSASSLYVGGDISYENGTIRNGQTTVSGDIVASGVTFEGGINADGSVLLTESKVNEGDIFSGATVSLQSAEVVEGDVAANDLVQTNSSINMGDATVSQSATLVNSEISNGTLTADSVSIDADSTASSVSTVTTVSATPFDTIDFDAIAEEVFAQSTEFGDMSINGTTTYYCAGETNCTADSVDSIVFSGNEAINIYSIDAEILSTGNKSITYDFSTTSYNIINVTGDVVELFNTGFYNTAFDGQYVDNNPAIDYRHDGTYTNNILFNFIEATELNLYSIGIKGSILAPYADVNFYNGHVDGNLIAASLSTPEVYLTNEAGETYLAPTGQINNYSFGVIQVPEPASIAFLLSASFLLLRRGRLERVA